MNTSFSKKHLLSLTVIWGGIALFPASAMATVADGVYAYEHGNYDEARAEWLPYAALGNPNALYNLGQLYRMGRGVETNYRKAEEYYLRAAEKGHIGAQRNLGTLYYFGRLGDVDYDKAYTWLSKAAVNGDPRSQLMTGTMNFNGESVEKSYIQAYAWIYLASQSGLNNAQNALVKLNDVMTADQISKAKEISPSLTSRQLSPDDIGLMVKQSDASSAASSELPELNAPDVQANSTTPLSESPQEQAEPVQEEQKSEDSDSASVKTEADNFRVQLGSFRDQAAAEMEFSRLKDRLPDLIGMKKANIEYVDLGAEKGIFYRLQLSPFTQKADASALCARLTENGQGCYVVKTP